MVHARRYADAQPYTTKDGSVIRELMHPAVHGNRNQSLAEATVAAGQRTVLHRHGRTEELYHVTSGRGRMTLGEESFGVIAGDTVCIPPGTPHCIENAGADDLVILCCCSPAYDHDDTELLE
jgi:mannose-6-phosphate isomerase-like protein (cupin superfamily)